MRRSQAAHVGKGEESSSEPGRLRDLLHLSAPVRKLHERASRRPTARQLLDRALATIQPPTGPSSAPMLRESATTETRAAGAGFGSMGRTTINELLADARHGLTT
jgi:hypothetical protein